MKLPFSCAIRSLSAAQQPSYLTALDATYELLTVKFVWGSFVLHHTLPFNILVRTPSRPPALLSLHLRTGFSKAARGARKITTESDVAEDFFHFMQSFLTVRRGRTSSPFFDISE